MTGIPIRELVEIFNDPSRFNRCLRLEMNEKDRVSQAPWALRTNKSNKLTILQVLNLYVARIFCSPVAFCWPERDTRDSTKNNKIRCFSGYFASHKLPLQPNTVLTYTIGIDRLVCRNYAADHPKLLWLTGGIAVDVLLILQWKTARERQFQSDLGFKVLLLFRRELSLSKKQSEYSWKVSSSSENKSQKPKTSFTIGHGVFHSICMRCYVRWPFPIPVT